MTATLVLCKNVNLSLELVMAGNCAGLCENLSSFDLVTVNTTEKSSDVVAGHSLVKSLSEHLDTGADSLLCLFPDTNDLNFVIEMQRTSLYTACSNGTTTGDREDVLDRHDEGLVSISLGIRNILINCIHELHDLVTPLT